MRKTTLLSRGYPTSRPLAIVSKGHEQPANRSAHLHLHGNRCEPLAHLSVCQLGNYQNPGSTCNQTTCIAKHTSRKTDN